MGRDVRGYEFDWIGVDSDDHVGVFSTAGCGVAPRLALDDPEQQDTAVEAITKLVERCDVLLSGAGIGNVSDWIAFARRGVFAYDGDYNGGPFRLIAIPRRPVLISELPPEIAEVALRIRFPAPCFGERRAFACSVIAAM